MPDSLKLRSESGGDIKVGAGEQKPIESQSRSKISIKERSDSSGESSTAESYDELHDATENVLDKIGVKAKQATKSKIHIVPGSEHPSHDADTNHSWTDKHVAKLAGDNVTSIVKDFLTPRNYVAFGANSTWASPSVAISAKPRFFTPALVSEQLLVFSIGPSGQRDPEVLYYVNEKPAPEIVMIRGMNYTIQTMTGMDQKEPLYYHPLLISPSEDAISPTMIGPAKGRLCLWSSSLNRQNVSPIFEQFAKSLSLSCDQGTFDFFSWTPDQSTPDRLFYRSASLTGIGGIITIIDPPKQ
jgi:hypothetical protein